MPTLHDLYNRPIPTQSASQHSITVPHFHDTGEALVSLSHLAENILVYPYYHHEGYAGALSDCYARESVARNLQAVASQLPPDYSLVILDAWRSYEVQKALYDSFKQSLIQAGWAEGEALTNELRKFVAAPSLDIEQPSRHLTGGAVDLTIVGPNGWLAMGTSFDDFSPVAATRYFEECTLVSEEEEQFRANRRLLYHLMTSVGFTNYAEEWWHYDYGNIPWARETTKEPLYKGVLTVSEII